MRCLNLVFFCFSLANLVFADTPKLWFEGRITSRQPFQAAVIAAGGVTPWSGTTHLYLVELGDKKRICIATLKVATATNLDNLVDYEIISPEAYELRKATLSKEPSEFNSCVFSPPLPIDRFAWVCPIGNIGRPFGDKDLLQDIASRLLKEARKKESASGADQPATAPESKSEGKDKNQPESKVRPR